MTNPLLWLLDRWARRCIRGKRSIGPNDTRPATVITGASEGIGLAIARRFAKAGHIVVLVARRETLLQAAAETIRRDFQTEVVALALDINGPTASGAIAEALSSRGLHTDILVNNAGFGLCGDFALLPVDEIDALISCNITALTRLSRHFLPGMLERGQGGLINIASLAGFAPGPYQAAYYASKSYVISLTRAIGYETRGSGVRVAVVTPGPVETAFHARMQAESSFYRTLVPSLSSRLVAAATYRGFMWHQRVIVPGLAAKIVSLAMRIVPHALVIPAVAWMLHPRSAGAATGDRDEKQRGGGR